MAQYTIKLVPPVSDPILTKSGSETVQNLIQQLLTTYKIDAKQAKQSFFFDSNCSKPLLENKFDVKTKLQEYFTTQRFVIYVKRQGMIQAVTGDSNTTDSTNSFENRQQYTQEEIKRFSQLENLIATTTHAVRDSSCSHGDKDPCLRCLQKNKERVLKEYNVSMLDYDRFLLYKRSSATTQSSQANISDLRLKTQQQLVLRPENPYKYPTMFFASHTMNAFRKFVSMDQRDAEFYFICYGRDNVVMYISIVPFTRINSDSCITTAEMWDSEIKKYNILTSSSQYDMEIIAVGMHSPKHWRIPRDVLISAINFNANAVILSYPDNSRNPRKMQSDDDFKTRFTYQNKKTRTIQATLDVPLEDCDTFNFIVHGVGEQIQFISKHDGIGQQTSRNVYTICLTQPVIINDQFMTEIDVECFLTPLIGLKVGILGDDFIYGKVPQHIISWKNYIEIATLNKNELKNNIPQLISQYSGSLCRDVQFKQLLDDAGFNCIDDDEEQIKQKMNKFLHQLID